MCLGGESRQFEAGRKRADGSDEAVAAARNGFDKGRVFGVIAECLAEAFDGGIEAGFEVHKGVRGPEGGTEFVAGDKLAAMLEEFQEDLIGLVLKTQLSAVTEELGSARVELKDTETVAGSGLRGQSKAPVSGELGGL